MVNTVSEAGLGWHTRCQHEVLQVAGHALCRSCFQRPSHSRLGWWAQSFVAGSGWHLRDSHCLQAGFLLASPVASSFPQDRTVLGWASVHSRGWAFAHLNHACSLCVAVTVSAGSAWAVTGWTHFALVWLEDCITRRCWFAWGLHVPFGLSSFV